MRLLEAVVREDPRAGHPAELVVYSYVANSPLVEQIAFKQGSVPRMTTTRKYDRLNRLQNITSVPSADPAVGFDYTYNLANQRTLRREADQSFWRYEYDSLGQVKSGKKFWADGTPVAGQQFEYAHDDIGNRTGTKTGGDANGMNLRPAAYSADLMNRYSSRTVPGAVDVMGAAFATANVAITGVNAQNNASAAYRNVEYFRKELSLWNTNSGPFWEQATISATGETPVIGNTFVPKSPEFFGYDADGNVTSDGPWTYGWDAENRLVSMVARTSVGPQQLIRFDYDWKSRRVGKKVWNNTAGTGSPASSLKFVYDGWNLLATLNSDLGLLTSFMWGLDLSGSLQGAGGVGGLLAVSFPGTQGAQTTNCFVAFDGNGNVAGLVNSLDGKQVAQYEYGPFGEVLRATGPMSEVNPFRFSTKYQDWETGLLYYTFRYYDLGKGRWLNCDPVGENGGENLYGFVHNDPIDVVDLVGLSFGNPVPPVIIQGPLPPPGPFPPIDGIPPGPLPPTPMPPAPPKPTPPGAPPGSPTSGSPTQPPGRPPGAPPPDPNTSGGVSDPASAAAAVLEICADVFSAAVNRAIYNNAIRECQSKMGTGGGSKCCVISWCVYCRCGNGLKDINRVGLYVANKSCAAVEADEKKYKTIHVSCPKNEKYVTTYYP